MVTTAGSASGIAATARDIAVRNISIGGSPRKTPIPKTIPHMAKTAKAIFCPKLARRF